MKLPSPTWRVLLLLSAILASQGGRLHPEADAAEPMRAELATMTASETWVPAHLLLLASVTLLAVGLWMARTHPAFSGVRRSLQVAAVAVSLYAVEAVAHLAAVLDSHALAHGEDAPVAMTHVVLAVVLYPVSGLAIAWLSLDLGRHWSGLRRWVVVPGVLGGLIHALTVPATLALPDAEISPFFAAAGILIAVWSASLALLAPTSETARPRELARDGVAA